MIIQTKYSINDRLFKIGYERKQEFEKCAACKGAGRVTLGDGDHQCPVCYGNQGRFKYSDSLWQVLTGVYTVGMVTASVKNIVKSGMFDNIGEYAAGADSQEILYMCYETGIGSGTIHYENTLWPSIEEAQLECDRLNASGDTNGQ